MNDHLLTQMRQLRLSQAAQALEQQRSQPQTYGELGFEERLALLLEHEQLCRETNRINRLRKQAHLRLVADAEHLDYSPERGLLRQQMGDLLSGGYLQRQDNILITGPTGCGKTYVACALAEQACRQHRRVRYWRLGRLLEALAVARADGSLPNLLSQQAKTELLLLDDWGLEKLTQRQAADLLEVMEDRYGLASTIIASQLPVEKWHQMLSNPTVADALLDRLIHNAHRIALKGESKRKSVNGQIDHSEP